MVGKGAANYARTSAPPDRQHQLRIKPELKVIYQRRAVPNPLNDGIKIEMTNPGLSTPVHETGSRGTRIRAMTGQWIDSSPGFFVQKTKQFAKFPQRGLGVREHSRAGSKYAHPAYGRQPGSCAW